MIHVLATARIREGCMAQALDCYRVLVPLVLANEPGCLAYRPTSDTHLGLGNQDLCAGEILVVEQWRSIDDFRQHLQMAHCAAFRQKIAPFLREGIRVRITQDCVPDVGCEQ